MRDLFRGYYQPTTDEVAAIWDGGLTVLDANVLLSLYKVLPATSALYLDAMEKRAEKNWLPYQVSLEFHRNVHKIRSEQTAGHAKRIKDVETFSNILRKTENKSRLQESDLQTQIQALLEKFLGELTQEQSGIKDQTHHHKPDDLLGRISELFTGRVGPKPTDGELDSLHERGKSRFDTETPPGYEDNKTKTGGDEFGDFIFWQQVMDHAKEHQTDILLVTDDNKADWWLKIGGNSVAPRPELIQEFREYTGQNIIIWNSSTFYHQLMGASQDASAEILAAADDMQEAVTRSQKSMYPNAKLHDHTIDQLADDETDWLQEFRSEEQAYRSAMLDEMDELTRRRFVGGQKYKSDVARGKLAYQSLKRAEVMQQIESLNRINERLSMNIFISEHEREQFNSDEASPKFDAEYSRQIMEFTQNRSTLQELESELKRLDDLI